MTHTLHRTRNLAGQGEEFILLSMAAQGYNNRGSEDKFRETFRIMLKHRPVNAGDDNIGGILTGRTVEEILSHANGKSYMAAVYDDREQAEAALRELKAVNLGLSVVVTGEREVVFDLLQRAGLTPHTVNMSLGYMGKVEKLPAPEVLDITSMCGHAMVCPDHVGYVLRQVRGGRMSARDGAVELARPCTCAMFNPSRAEALLTEICRRRRAAGVATADGPPPAGVTEIAPDDGGGRS